MEYSSLNDLLTCLTFDSNLHIAVVFLRDSGNVKTELPENFSYHTKPFCVHMKRTPEGYEKCFVCRNFALNKAVSERKAFGHFCVNGIYEYCHPVIYEDEVVAVIFLGNILRGNCCHEMEFFLRQLRKRYSGLYTGKNCICNKRTYKAFIVRICKGRKLLFPACKKHKKTILKRVYIPTFP